MLTLLQAEGVVCGVDEAGRGPLAGPVVAAAVILDPARPIAGLNDSKQLSARRRVFLAEQIRGARWPGRWRKRASRRSTGSTSCRPACWPCSGRSTALVDRHRLLPVQVLVDGNCCPELAYPVEAIIGGDGKIAAIAAASILAKTVRDAACSNCTPPIRSTVLTATWAIRPRYTCEALREHGASPHHRRSFGPVARLSKP
jgi:ribonuclease HII